MSDERSMGYIERDEKNHPRIKWKSVDTYTAELECKLEIARDLIDWIVAWKEHVKTDDKGLAEYIIAQSIEAAEAMKQIDGGG